MASPASFLRRRFHVPADVVDDFCADLWCGEPLGLEIRGETVEVYYDERVAAGSQWKRWQARGVALRRCEVVPDEDWLAKYRHLSSSFAVGSRFWVDPGEPSTASECPAGRHRLRLPARRAFGTGSHESTRLAVAWLERIPLAGKRVLDLGSGSGVLSFAALLLGARGVVGVECDVEAGLTGAQNRRLNRLWPTSVVGTVDAIDAAARFDLIVANVLLPRLRPALPRLASLVRDGGSFVYSGALMDSEQEVLEVLALNGLQAVASRRDGDWGAWLLRLEGGA